MRINATFIKTTLTKLRCHPEFIKLTVILNVFLTHILEKNSNFKKISFKYDYSYYKNIFSKVFLQIVYYNFLDLLYCERFVYFY